MNNFKDLNLHLDILPLFDFTLNDSSKNTLVKLFREPLSSTKEIETRQKIIKGFIDNLETFRHYSYSRFDFCEVEKFLNKESINNYKKSLNLRLLFSEKQRHQTRGKFIQFVVLFQQLQVYLGRTNTRSFLPEYKNELLKLNQFLISFNFDLYNERIREGNFKTKHIAQLAQTISEKQLNGEVDIFFQKFYLFEAYLSISKGISKNRFCFPAFSEGNIAFEDLYHPLLKNPVKNSFATRNNVTILSGPNMSGKSTFLKSVGLCIYLAHIGVGVPATKAELPFFDHLTVSINHNDDISSGYSHFMTEVNTLKRVLVAATINKKSCAIFDELFKGTNSEEAFEITSAILRGLTKFRNSFFFISTHLHQLKDIDLVKTKQVDTYYIDCEIKGDIPLFNYQIKEGWSDLRVGRLLFEKEGLNALLQAKPNA